MQTKWLERAQRIRAIAQAGLAFSKDVYDRERYEELMKLSIEITRRRRLKSSLIYGVGRAAIRHRKRMCAAQYSERIRFCLFGRSMMSCGRCRVDFVRLVYHQLKTSSRKSKKSRGTIQSRLDCWPC